MVEILNVNYNEYVDIIGMLTSHDAALTTLMSR